MGFKQPWWERFHIHITCIGLTVAALLFSLFIALYFFIIPKAIEQSVLEKSSLAQGGEVEEAWRNSSYHMPFKVFIYQAENPTEILRGSKPLLRAIGPFTFNKHIINENLYHRKGTLTFDRRVLYIFNKSASCPKCDLSRRVRVPNLVYQKSVERAVSSPLLGGALLGQTPFVTLTAREFLFEGYKDPFLETLCAIPVIGTICNDLDLPERIGLFYGYNNSHYDGRFTISEGADNPMDRGKVLAYNGLQTLNRTWWRSAEALSLRGTEGTLFPPLMNDVNEIPVYANLLCRTMTLQYNNTVNYRGVAARRFTINPEQMDSSRRENAGYCHPTPKVFYKQQEESRDHCYPQGLHKVASCKKGSPPVVVSLGNFYGAPENVRDSVFGLNDTSESDGIIVDVEPTLGVALRATRSYQVNIEFWSGVNITLPVYHRKMRSTLIPLVLIHDDAYVDDATFEKMDRLLFTPRRYAYTFCLALAIVSIILFVLTLCFACLARRRVSVHF